MTIELPLDLARFVREAVERGRFPSEHDAILEAVRLMRDHEPRVGSEAAVEPKAPGQSIWEAIAEITSAIPEEDFLKLPVDGASQHDHYLYGTPKRPS